MRNAILWTAGLLCSAVSAFGISCRGPASIEEFLSPNTAVFMGNIAYVDHKPVYQVSEMLWGDLPDRQPYGRTDFRMFAVRLDSKGKPIRGGCDSDWLPLDHEWITDIRRALQIRLPANLTIWVRSDPGAADIAGADVTLSGNGKQFRGQTRSDGRFELPTLIPPGNYRITASKAGYAAAEEPVAILPGGGGYAEIRLKASSQIGGIVTDHLGNPLPRLTGLDLIGWDDAKARIDYSRSQAFTTDGNGAFRITGVMPGKYFLGCNIPVANEPRRCVFPKVAYPGVQDLRRALPVFVDEGHSVVNLEFRLPDFGPKRTLRIRVTDENGEPLPGGTLIENGPAQEDDRVMAALPEDLKTDEDGNLELQIWSNATYSIAPRWVGNRTYRQRLLDLIPPGKEQVSLVVQLKGF